MSSPSTSPVYGETPIGKGLDKTGAALFWVRAAMADGVNGRSASAKWVVDPDNHPLR